MIVSFSIMKGFESEIKTKIFSFDSHIQITKYDSNNGIEDPPLSVKSPFYLTHKQNPFIKSMSPFATKAGIINWNGEVFGTVFKGISNGYDSIFFQKHLKSGKIINFNSTESDKDIMVSEKIANKLNLKIDDKILIYFVQNPPKYRKLRVKGIFNSGMDEFDQMYIIGKLELLQDVNRWGDSLVGGYEIKLYKPEMINDAANQIVTVMDYDMGLEKISDKYIQLFDWMNLLNKNVIIFLGLLFFVACFNIISTLLVMIMERINMIGTLKAFGATNFQIRQIFMFNGILIILRGLLIGNLIGLSICAIQYFFKIIPLDPENYYMESVPIQWDFITIIITNFLLFTCLTLVLLIPTLIISRFRPIHSIRFD